MRDAPSGGVELESRPCPLCTGSGAQPRDEPVLTGHDRLHGGPGTFTVVRCARCGLMRTDPRPTRAGIGAYYPTSYAPYRPPAAPAGGQPGAGARGGERFIRFRTRPVPAASPGRMLEVGCASGAFLQRMHGQGWTVAGIEPSPEAAASARALGFPVQAARILEADPPDQPYDLVVGFMVLEHLHEPVAALERLREWTRPGGWLVVSTPDAGCFQAKVFGDAWYDLEVPRHLYHYTPRTLTAVLERAGWQVDRVLHQRVLSSLFPSLGFRLSDAGARGPVVRALVDYPRLADRWLLHYLLFPLATALAAMGQTGRMTVWGRAP